MEAAAAVEVPASQVLAVNQNAVGYGQSQVIPGLSFAAGENEIVAIMGRNGMGKTTLFKALMGILPVRAGSVVLAGQLPPGQDDASGAHRQDAHQGFE